MRQIYGHHHIGRYFPPVGFEGMPPMSPPIFMSDRQPCKIISNTKLILTPEETYMELNIYHKMTTYILKIQLTNTSLFQLINKHCQWAG